MLEDGMSLLAIKWLCQFLQVIIQCSLKKHLIMTITLRNAKINGDWHLTMTGHSELSEECKKLWISNNCQTLSSQMETLTHGVQEVCPSSSTLNSQFTWSEAVLLILTWDCLPKKTKEPMSSGLETKNWLWLKDGVMNMELNILIHSHQSQRLTWSKTDLPGDI